MEDWIKHIAQKFTKIHETREPYVCRREIFAFIDMSVNLLYPSRCEEFSSPSSRWESEIDKMNPHLVNIFTSLKTPNPESQSQNFLESLPAIKKLLDTDAQFFAEEDPASQSLAEVILCYPGFLALIIHRLAHQLYSQNIPLLPRIVSEYAHSKTGIDIHPGARLGCPIFIDHGTGIVIGETCVIHHRVKIFQGVTLGAPSVERAMKGQKRHPTVGSDVILYANATILGGETVIGDGSIIGGNVWITSSVSPGSKIYYQRPEKQ